MHMATWLCVKSTDSVKKALSKSSHCLFTCFFAAKSLKSNKSFQLRSVFIDTQRTLKENNKPINRME